MENNRYPYLKKQSVVNLSHPSKFQKLEQYFDSSTASNLADFFIIAGSTLISAIPTIFQPTIFSLNIGQKSYVFRVEHLTIFVFLFLLATLLAKIVILKQQEHKYQKQQQEIERLAKENDSLKCSLAKMHHYYDFFQESLREILHHSITEFSGKLNFSSHKKGHIHRITFYLAKQTTNKQTDLIPVKRISNHKKFSDIREGRTYSPQIGFLGKAWNEGNYFGKSPDSKTKRTYLDWHKSVGLVFDSNMFRMQSKLYFGKRLDIRHNSERSTAVIMVESTNRNAFTKDKLEKVFENTDFLTYILHKFGDEISSLNNAKRRGL